MAPRTPTHVAPSESTTDEPVVEDNPSVEEMLRSLWALTPEHLRGKLPKPYKKDATKGECKECGGYHGLPAMHLDYLGHADTCRLIAEKDPYWQWEPKAGWDPETGEPKFVRARDGYPIALWIDLTILGVTRPGVGTVAGNKSDPEKELIGDAIRNAAMRFGIGADMWSKAMHDDEIADGPERTYNRAPAAPVSDWFVEHGWKGQLHHDEARSEIAAAVAALPEEAKPALKAWLKDQTDAPEWRDPWPEPFARAVSDRVKALSVPSEPSQDDEKAPSAPQTPDPAPDAELAAPADLCPWCQKPAGKTNVVLRGGQDADHPLERYHKACVTEMEAEES